MKKILCSIIIVLIILTGCTKKDSKIETDDTLIDNTLEISSDTSQKKEQMSEEKELCNNLAQTCIEYWNDYEEENITLPEGTVFFYDLNNDGKDEFFFLFSDYKTVKVVIYQITDDNIQEIGTFNSSDVLWKIYKNNDSIIMKTDTIIYMGASVPTCSVTENYIQYNNTFKNEKLDYIQDIKTRNKIDNFSYILGDKKTELPIENYDEKVNEILEDRELTDVFVIKPLECENITDKKIFSDFIYSIIINK